MYPSNRRPPETHKCWEPERHCLWLKKSCLHLREFTSTHARGMLGLGLFSFLCMQVNYSKTQECILLKCSPNSLNSLIQQNQHRFLCGTLCSEIICIYNIVQKFTVRKDSLKLKYDLFTNGMTNMLRNVKNI